MDLLPSIDELQEHLYAHDLAVRQIIALDHYIEQQSDLACISVTGDCDVPPFQQLIRTAVAEGIKRMYKEYRLQKWLKVQEMANTVRQVLNPEYQQDIQNEPVQSADHTHQMSVDHPDQTHQDVPVLAQYIQPAITPTIQPVYTVGEESQVRHELVSPILSSLPGPELTHISPVPSPLSRLLSPISTPIVASLQEYRHIPDDHSSPIVTNRQLFPDGHCPDYQPHRQQPSVHQLTDSSINNMMSPHSLHPSNTQHTEPTINTTSQPHSSSTTTNNQNYQPTHSQHDINTVSGAPAVSNYHNHDIPDLYSQEQLDNTEDMDWDSDYDDSEENLAGVLFATETLLPEEQATRLDVEMGDMGVGHVLFDRVSAAWQRYQCTYQRGG